MSTPAMPEDRPDTTREEVLTEAAHRIVEDDLTTLTHWVASHPTVATSYVDHVIQHLGVPEPDYYEDGIPRPGSVTRKLLLWARRAEITDALMYTTEEAHNAR